MPKATNTSRKFTPTAATATRICPASSSVRGHGLTTKSSSVPPPPASSRQLAAGSRNTAPLRAGRMRAA